MTRKSLQKLIMSTPNGAGRIIDKVDYSTAQLSTRKNPKKSPVRKSPKKSAVRKKSPVRKSPKKSVRPKKSTTFHVRGGSANMKFGSKLFDVRSRANQESLEDRSSNDSENELEDSEDELDAPDIYYLEVTWKNNDVDLYTFEIGGFDLMHIRNLLLLVARSYRLLSRTEAEAIEARNDEDPFKSSDEFTDDMVLHLRNILTELFTG
jgi:hypothetical protein